jgi:uncharacterized protein YifE (UPF0438 family)
MNPPKPAPLTAREEALIRKYAVYYRALEKGDHEPSTPAQHHFVAVCRGDALPETDHEIAYLKFRLLVAWKAENKRHRKADPSENNPVQRLQREREALEAWSKRQGPIRTDRRRVQPKSPRPPSTSDQDARGPRRQQTRESERHEPTTHAGSKGIADQAEHELTAPPCAPARGEPSHSMRGKARRRRSRDLDELAAPHTTPISLPDREDGHPAPGWFTDEDWKRMHPGRR